MLLFVFHLFPNRLSVALPFNLLLKFWDLQLKMAIQISS